MIHDAGPGKPRRGETFRKQEHIIKSKDFAVVYRNGLSCKIGILVLSFLPNNLPHNRLGFSISSRNVKLASARNRIKRVFREVYRKKRPGLKSGYDMVFIIKRSPHAKMAYKEAEDLFSKAVIRAGLLA